MKNKLFSSLFFLAMMSALRAIPMEFLQRGTEGKEKSENFSELQRMSLEGEENDSSRLIERGSLLVADDKGPVSQEKLKEGNDLSTDDLERSDLDQNRIVDLQNYFGNKSADAKRLIQSGKRKTQLAKTKKLKATDPSEKKFHGKARDAAFAEVAAFEALSNNADQGLQCLTQAKKSASENNLRLQQRWLEAAEQYRASIESFATSAEAHARGDSKEGRRYWGIANDNSRAAANLVNELKYGPPPPEKSLEENIVNAEAEAVTLRARANEVKNYLLKNPTSIEAKNDFGAADFIASMAEARMDRLKLRQETEPLRQQMNDEWKQSKNAAATGNKIESRRLECLALASKTMMELVENQSRGLIVDTAAHNEALQAIEEWNKAAEAYLNRNIIEGKQWELSAQRRKAIFNKAHMKAMRAAALAALEEYNKNP